MADNKDPFFASKDQRASVDPLDDLMRSLNRDDLLGAGGTSSRPLPKEVEMRAPSRDPEAYPENYEEPSFEGGDAPQKDDFSAGPYEVEAQYAEPSFAPEPRYEEPRYEEPQAGAYQDYAAEEPYLDAAEEEGFEAESGAYGASEPSFAADDYRSPYDAGLTADEPLTAGAESAYADTSKVDPSLDVDAYLSSSLSDELDKSFLSNIGAKPAVSARSEELYASPSYEEAARHAEPEFAAEEPPLYDFDKDFEATLAASLDFGATATDEAPLTADAPLYAEPEFAAEEPSYAEPSYAAPSYEEPRFDASPQEEDSALSIDEDFLGQYGAAPSSQWSGGDAYREPAFRGSYGAETPDYSAEGGLEDDPFDLTASLAESLQASLEQSLAADAALIEGRDAPSFEAQSYAPSQVYMDDDPAAEDELFATDSALEAPVYAEAELEESCDEPSFEGPEYEPEEEVILTSEEEYDDPYEASLSAAGLATPIGAALGAGVAAAAFSSSSTAQKPSEGHTAEVHTFQPLQSASQPPRQEPSAFEVEEAISIADLASQYEREVAAREVAKHQPQIEDDAAFPFDEIEKEPRKSRGLAPWLMYGGATVVVLLSVGVGYTLLFAGGGQAGYSPPPIIRADTSEVRSAPEGAAATETQTAGGNLIFDRVTGTESRPEERIVPRQEDVLQVPSSSSNQLAAESQQDQQALSPGSPRRVQSVSINPDGTITRTQVKEPRLPEGAQSSAQTGAESTGVRVIDTSRSDSASAQPQTQAQGETQVAQSAADAGLRTGAETSAQPAEATQPQSAVNPDDLPNINLTSAPIPPRRPAQIGGSSASAAQPVALQTPVSASGAQQVDGRAALEQAQASVAQPSQPAVRANSASGGFVVQLSATRSEQEALSAFSAYQNRFPSILSGQSPNIQKADLGSRGIYYRLGVGPLTSRDDANNMCSQLRSAGLPDCFVRAN